MKEKEFYVAPRFAVEEFCLESGFAGSTQIEGVKPEDGIDWD